MNNPAARLHHILDECRTNESIRNELMETGWREVLYAPEYCDEFDVMLKVSKVMCLPSLISDEIEQIKGLDSDIYLGWVGDLKKAYKRISFGNAFSDFSSALSDSLMSSLRICAIELENSSKRDQTLSANDLDEIRDELCTLLDKITAADLDPELSDYLLDHLDKLIESIEDYLITGIVGIERVLHQIIGSSRANPKTAKDVRESELGKKFISLCGKAYTLLNLVDSGKKLVEQAYELIE